MENQIIVFIMHIRAMLSCGVDMIITDKPDVALAQLNHCERI